MTLQPPPPIAPVANASGNRPFWSVMIPTYRPKENYLRQALESALQQDPGADQMQIEVVDDSSPDVDVEAMVKSIGGGRVAFSRTPKNLGLAGCWNTCIERSRGQWVHILHQDDYILPGFYQKLRQVAEQQLLQVALIATRSFAVDDCGVILTVSPRYPELEKGQKAVDVFFDVNPIQCPGVAVRRTFYEEHGGFRGDLTFTLDVEMWARATGYGGCAVTPDVLACFRRSEGSETARLNRLGESIRDADRLIGLFAERYPSFNRKRIMLRLCDTNFNQARRLSENGHAEAAKANWDYWRKNMPLQMQLRVVIGRLAGKLSRWLRARD